MEREITKFKIKSPCFGIPYGCRQDPRSILETSDGFDFNQHKKRGIRPMEGSPILQDDSQKDACHPGQVHKEFDGTDEGHLESKTIVLVD